MTLELVSPKLNYSSQVKLTDHLMRLNQRIHVCFQTVLGIDTLLVKLDLDKAIRVCSNDEIYFCPIHHDYFLYVVDDIRQLLLRKSFKTPVLLRRSEVSTEDLLLVKPLGSKNFLFTSFIWIVMYEIWHDIVLMFVLRKETIVILPVILIHTSIEGPFADKILLTLTFLSLILLVL